MTYEDYIAINDSQPNGFCSCELDLAQAIRYQMRKITKAKMARLGGYEHIFEVCLSSGILDRDYWKLLWQVSEDIYYEREGDVKDFSEYEGCLR